MNTNSEDQNAMLSLALKATFKTALNMIPLAGPILSEVLFEYRSKVKQDRVLKFMDLLKEEFSQSNCEINIDTIKSEEFGDLFEKVLRKVSETRSEKKRNAFKNLLMRGVEVHMNIETAENYSNVLMRVSDTDIKILNRHKDFLYNGENLSDARINLEKQINDRELRESAGIKEPDFSSSLFVVPNDTLQTLKNKLAYVETLMQEYRKVFLHKYFAISKPDFNYSLHNLYNNGLLKDDGVGSIGTKAFEVMGITEFGVKFLDYIEFS